MAGFAFDAALRWARLDRARTLARRPDAELPFLADDRIGGQALLLDSCVYIDNLQRRSPDIVQAVIDTRQVNHSSVAIQELVHSVGALDPRDPRTATAIPAIRGLILSMPPHRTFAPDLDVLGRAALLSGMLSRLQGHDRNAKLRALQDCVLFLQAQKLGLTVLTANVADFDILLQLQPGGRALFYRRAATA